MSIQHKIIMAFSIMILSLSAVFAQTPDTLWTKTFGDSGNDGAGCVEQTDDGGYIIGCGGFATLIKTDEFGDSIWTRDYGLIARSVVQTEDGGYIFACDGFADLVKTDEFGDSIWTRDFDIDAFCVLQTTDGGYIVAGSIGIEGFWHSCLLKTDSSGDIIWQQTYIIGDVSSLPSVQQTTDGGYIAASLAHFEEGCWDYCLLKTNASGDSMWTRIYGRPGTPDEVYAVAQTDDGGYILTGLYFWTLKTDESGDSLWSHYYGEGEIGCAFSIQQTYDGGYIIAGTVNPMELPDEGQFYIIKTNSIGEIAWDNYYGGGGLEHGYYAIQTSDGGYVATGYTSSYGAGGHDVWLIKIGGETSVQELSGSIPEGFYLGTNYPNPFNASTTIRYTLPKPSHITIDIHSILGQKVETLLDINQQAGFYQVTWNAENRPSGVYFYKIQAGDYIETKKMILLK